MARDLRMSFFLGLEGLSAMKAREMREEAKLAADDHVASIKTNHSGETPTEEQLDQEWQFRFDEVMQDLATTYEEENRDDEDYL